VSKKTRTAKKIKAKKQQARKAKKAAKRKKLLKARLVATQPKIDYTEVVLSLLEEEDSTPQSVHDYIMENAMEHELDMFDDAIEDLLVDLEDDDPMAENIKELHRLFMSEE
jgi:hypothetical protein